MKQTNTSINSSDCNLSGSDLDEEEGDSVGPFARNNLDDFNEPKKGVSPVDLVAGLGTQRMMSLADINKKI